MKKHKHTLGLLGLFGGVGLFSMVEVVSKLIGTGVSHWQLVFLRFFVTGLVLLALMGKDLPKRLAVLTRRDYGIFALSGMIGIAISLSLFHLALQKNAKAASCAVVFSANPIFVMLLARFINREPLNWIKVLAMLCGLTGIGFFAWESGAFDLEALEALVLMTISAFFFAAGICISRRVIHRYGVFLLMGMTGLWGSLMVFPFAAVSFWEQGITELVKVWEYVAILVLLGTTVAYGLYYFGLRHCTAFQASMTFFLKPVLASLVAMWWLKEVITLPMIAGSFCILSGLVITVMFSARGRSSKN